MTRAASMKIATDLSDLSDILSKTDGGLRGVTAVPAIALKSVEREAANHVMALAKQIKATKVESRRKKFLDITSA
jgi:transaldolase